MGLGVPRKHEGGARSAGGAPLPHIQSTVAAHKRHGAPIPDSLENVPEPFQRIQVMPDAEILAKRDPVQRLPRQAAHYAQIVGHFLEVKDSKEIARAIAAHFQRLAKYHQMLLGIADAAAPDDDQED